MEISIKQRLVGAVVLVAAAVIILPMIFDGPRPDSTATRTVPLPLPASEPAVELDIDSGQPVSSAGAAIQSVPVQNAKSADARKTSPAPATSVTGSDGSSAPTTPTAAAESASPTVGDSPLASKPGWAVQAGSFSDPDHAEALANRLQGKGLSAFVQRHTAAGRTLYRVRVGPYPQRIDAERQAPAVAAAAGGPTKVVPTP